MKTMKIMGITGVALFVAAAAALTAHAGQKVSNPYVKIEYWATGDVGGVRANSTTTEFIGCRVWSYPTSIYTYCSAYDSTRNLFRACQSNAPYMAQAAAAINGDSRVEFFWTGSGGANDECGFIRVTNDSQLRPKSL